MKNILDIVITQSPTFAILVFMLYYVIQDRKATQHKEEKKDSMQNAIEKEFREYLIEQGKEHHIIINRNTDAYEKLVDIIKEISYKIK